MTVMKFGGSSLADGPRIRAAMEIVRTATEREQTSVVLSAMKGITDTLISAAHAAERGDSAHHHALEGIRRRHLDAIADLMADDPERQHATSEAVSKLLVELEQLLHGIELVRECSPRSLDLIVGFGERLNCTVVAAFLSATGTPALMVDARELIVTDASHGAAIVDLDESYRRIADRLAAVDVVPVITGFIAATREGVATTLGRNGSDYTASIVGAAIGASAVEIWTDVDGVMSADPRSVPGAFVIDDLSLVEAMELSYFGAEVIHPYTMIPAIERSVPLWIRNTLNPSVRGTRISDQTDAAERAITGIASIGSVALINIEGGGMMGIPGMASRVFGALARAGVNVIMISQASSEHSICVCIRERELAAATRYLREELRVELDTRRIDQFVERKGLEIIAVIGASMRGSPGIAGRLFSALGAAEVNILAIAQGSSEMNISFVVARSDADRSLNAVHDAFFGAGE